MSNGVLNGCGLIVAHLYLLTRLWVMMNKHLWIDCSSYVFADEIAGHDERTSAD